MTTLLEHLNSGNLSGKVSDIPVIPPEEHPDYYLNKDRIEQNNTALNAAKYGWYGGVSDFFHYLQAIPGAINEVNDIIVSKTGVGKPSEGTVLESIEEYFEKVSRYYDPVRRDHTPPLGVKNKAIANFASLPGIFAQYVPTTRVLGSLPLGFAVTDSIKAGYDGTAHDVPLAFGKGYLLGTTVKLLSALRTMPARIGSLSALGFGITPKGHDGNMDDKIAAAITWGSFGIAPAVWGKTARPDKIKQEKAEVDLEPPINKTLLDKHSDVSAELQKQYVLAERQEAKTDKTEKDKINLIELKEQIKDKEQAIVTLESSMWYDAKVTSKIATNEANNITPEIARLDYFKEDGSPKYRDMSDTQFKVSLSNLFRKGKPVFTIGEKIKAHIFPLYFSAELFTKTNPMLKRVESELRRWRILTEANEEGILHDPFFNASKFLRRSLLKGETIEQYNKRVPRSRAKYGLVLTAMRHAVEQPSERGSLTALEGLLKTNVKSAWNVINAFISAHDFKLKHVEAELIRNGKTVTQQAIGKEYLTKNKDGTFKYQITNKELESNFKLNAEETNAFTRLAWGLSEVRRMNNSRFDHYGYYHKKIPEIPNYFPHMWMGAYKVGVNKIITDKATGETKSTFVKAIHSDSALESGRAKKMLEKEYKKLETETDTESITYNVNEIKPKLSDIGKQRQDIDINLDVFSESIQWLKKMDRFDEATTIANVYNFLAAKKGFTKHTLQRKNIKGWLGSADSLVPEGVISRSFNVVLGKRTQWRQINDFLKSYEAYVRGGVRNAYNNELDVRIRRFFEGPTQDTSLTEHYPRFIRLSRTAINNATGRFSGETLSKSIDAATAFVIKAISGGQITLTQRTLLDSLGGLNKITLAMKLLFGNTRYLAASGIQPDQMITAKLVELAGYSAKNNNLVAKSYAQATYDLFSPSKDIIELVQYGKSERAFTAAFIREFVPAGTTLVTAFKPLMVKNKILLDPNKLFDTLSLKDLASSFEQVSRLRALLLFNRVLLNSTKKDGTPLHTKEIAKVLATRYADAYMVEYNRTERPWIYNRLGALGKTAGLFKTFSHNWFAQLYRYMHQSKVYHNDAPLATFLYMHLLAAGILNYVAKDEINALIGMMQPVLKKFNKNKPVPDLDQILLEGDRDNWVLFGVPSTILNADITPTVKAPSFKLKDLITFPAWEVLGIDPVGLLSSEADFFTKKGIIPSSFSLFFKMMEFGIDEKGLMSEWIAFHKSYAPTSMHGFIEAYYSGRDIKNILFEVINDKLGTELSETFLKSNYPDFKTFPVRNTSKQIGTIFRSDKDWMKRYFSTRSIREAKMLKIVALLTRIKRTEKADKRVLTNLYAHYLVLNEVPPSYILEKYMALGGSPNDLSDSARKRVEHWQSFYSETSYFDVMKMDYPDQYMGLIDKLEKLFFSDLERK